MTETSTPAAPAPDILDAMIQGERAVIEQIIAADPAYYAYVRRHRAERWGRPMSVTEFHRIRRELDSLYKSTTEALRRRDPDLYAEQYKLILHYERELVA